MAHGGEAVSVDRLADELWGDSPPSNLAGALHTKVWQLRRALDDAEPGAGELVVSRPPGYLLDVAADAVDARRFAALLATAHESTDLRAKAALLGDALAQWRGPALADFVDADFTQPVVARLEELRLTALEDRAEVMLGPGELRHPALHVGRGAGAGTERGAGRVAPGDPGARPAAHAHAVPDHDGRPPADQPAGADDAADRPGRGDRARARPAGREQAGHAQRHRRHRRHRRRRQDAGAGRRRRGHGPLPDGVWLVELATLESPDGVVEVVATVLGVRTT
ncbi:hypothetical protein K7G98_19120 [Saccharothrix sp. MB29]|nr:hypothetical protein [Saccharothrix sp. MB29]